MIALLELHFSDHAKLSKDGKSFDCSTCPKQVKRLRRCEEDREDFTHKDSNIFPIQIKQGGVQYGFCPAKAGWEPVYRELFNLLMISTKTGNLLIDGGILEQPEWFVEMLGEFSILYDHYNFVQKAEMILGSDDKMKTSQLKNLNKRGLGNGRN